MFHRGGNFTATGQGDVGGVFASVLDAAGKFLSKYKPSIITFSAGKIKGDSKVRLYAALVKRFATKFGYTSLPHPKSNSDTEYWKLVKK
jgi:hypothetical protein